MAISLGVQIGLASRSLAGGGGSLQMVQETTFDGTEVASATHVHTLPTVVNGNRLLLAQYATNDLTTMDTPAGWTLEKIAKGVASYDGVVYLYSKIADGDSGATVTVTFTSGANYGCASFWEVEAPEGFLEVEGDDTSGDPPAITPSAGNAEYLFLGLSAHQRTTTTLAGPAGYSPYMKSKTHASATSGTSGVIASAYLVKTATTEGPLDFGWSLTLYENCAMMIALR